MSKVHPSLMTAVVGAVASAFVYLSPLISSNNTSGAVTTLIVTCILAVVHFLPAQQAQEVSNVVQSPLTQQEIQALVQKTVNTALNAGLQQLQQAARQPLPSTPHPLLAQTQLMPAGVPTSG